MEPLTDRISNYLLRRMRRLAVLDLYVHATGVGLLDQHHAGENKSSGTSWSVSSRGAALLTGDRDSTRRLVGRALKRGPAREDNDEFDGQTFTDRWSPLANDPGQPATVKATKSKSGGSLNAESLSRTMLPLLREFLPPPNAVHVAVALLVARAVGACVADLKSLREILQQPNPVLLFRVHVRGFERYLGLMLEDALIAAFWASLTDIAGGTPLSAHYRESRPEKRRRKVMTGSGRASSSFSDMALRRQLSNVLLGDAVPLLIADETASAVRPQIRAAADVIFECGGIDNALIAELLQICCGIPTQQSLDCLETIAFDPAMICLDDLALTVKAGRSVETMLEYLTSLSAAHGEDDDDDDDGRDKTSSRKSRLSSKTSRNAKPMSSTVDIIQPDAEHSVSAEPTKTVADKAGDDSDTSSMVQPVRSLRVEMLAGYGEARGWALDLKEDLPLWREGVIGWDEMSTKMLLSGPPGTGKTTYAKALCNSLQVPLVVSSVASWLEPGYLGDVLQKMSATFEAARENAPCILFIDEIDAIGSRGGGQGSRHDDYWTTIITRLLELLDGAIRTEGVIVVAATNLPHRIDAALLRSGRLEKHVAIPSPDAEALAGILVHHLGPDLAAVLASAPGPVKANAKNLPSEPAAPQSGASKPSHVKAVIRKGQAHV